MSEILNLKVRALDSATWDPYAALIERHNGVWGGCWCMVFHDRFTRGTDRAAIEARRCEKRALVESGRAHAALVFNGETCVGWAQFGSAAELPQIRSRKAYEAELGADPLPDWRISCFFTDRNYRRAGVAGMALAGALEQIAWAGGGTIEAYPEEMAGQKRSAGMLWSGTMGLFERAGFAPVRKIGKHRWVVRRSVDPSLG